MHSRLARTIVTNLGFSASFDSLGVRIIHILVSSTYHQPKQGNQKKCSIQFNLDLR